MKLAPLAAAISASLLVSACVDLDDDNDSSSNDTKAFVAESSSYKFEYIADGDIVGGVGNYTLKVTSKDGSDLTGDVVSAIPVMDMNSGMEHSTPVSSDGGELDIDGEFNATAYYLMESGDSTGSWALDVELNDETASIPLTINWDEGGRATLYGDADDQIKNMSGEKVNRPYYIFYKGMHKMNNRDMYSVYVGTREDMMNYQAVEEGNVLSSEMEMDMSTMSLTRMGDMNMESDSIPDLTISSVEVKICLENCDDSSNYQTTEVGSSDGVYTLKVESSPADLSALHVTVNVNGDFKTNADGTVNSAMLSISGESEMADMDHSDMDHSN